MRRISFAFSLCLIFPAFALAADKLDFNQDIRPILSDKCFRCHGFDEKKREAGLRLDSAEGATLKLESGATAVVPGKSNDSELIKRILATDKDQKMPPEASGKTLSASEIATLRRWIDEGAEFKGHWAFIPPVRPELPKVNNAAAVKNPIDAFIIARLEKAQLGPSPVADKATLIRRATLDITGLPPTPAEVDAFLADNSAEAFEKVIDRLLKSPRYGEHMGRYWLDAARYGDTHGLHLDNERGIWPYRDYVIGAFNENMPLNRFFTEQMAGDLLPNATKEQKIATGFNRCNVTTSEGGSINDEVLVRYAVDRVETMSTVFLGLTLGCAVCHDHKYDPVSQKEFYQLYAFFSASADAAMDGNTLLPPPFLKTPTAEQEQQLAALDAQLKENEKKRDERIKQIAAEYADPGPKNVVSTERKDFVWIDDALPAGVQAQGEWKHLTKAEFSAVQSGEKVHTQTGAGTVQHFFTGANPPLIIGEEDKLFGYVFLDPQNPPKTVMMQWNDGTWEHRAFWGEDAIAFGSDPKSVAHRHIGPLPELGKWVRLEVPAADVGLAAGAKVNGWAFTQADGTVTWDQAGLHTRTPQDGLQFESLAEWDAYERSLKESKLPEPAKGIVKLEPEKRNEDQKKQLLEYFLKNVYSKTKDALQSLDKEVADIAKKKTDLDNSFPASLVMQDMPKARDTFVLIRGQYDKKGEQVQAAIPAALGKLPEGAPANRLGLAHWLTDPQHPLTSRVFVNRLWQQYFGVGLVKTAEDFGSQGQWPSHPELLDYLSRDLVDNNWDLKRLIKSILMSGTYQQSSRVTPELLQKDPQNELLSRGPRFRIDAEMLRDNALFLSGLLTEKLGGKSVKPYQPAGIWEAVGFQGSNTLNFKQDQGESLYRRSLYTYWKRTSPPPSMMSFDAPSRESCVVRRARTNTPLQALVLMNDTQYVEAARFFAQKMIADGGSSPAERLQYGFRLATSRKASDKEVAVLGRLYEAHLADFTKNKDAAAKLLAVGESKTTLPMEPHELAAYTMVANLILNLDETVTKE